MSVKNKRLVLVMGETGTGKTSSLRSLSKQDGVLYLNCEAGKDLPFRNKFQKVVISDPYQIYDEIDKAEQDPNMHTVVVDSITMLMEMFESVHICTAADTRSAWGDYNQFVKNLMQQYIAVSRLRFIILAHTDSELDESTGIRLTRVPVKGALKKNGLEAFFSVAVSCKKMPTKDLSAYDSELLEITPEEESLGFKYVYQTKITKQTIGERIRGPFDMFTNKETYMDNDAETLLNVLDDYYS